jgi:hypothetical protein
MRLRRRAARGTLLGIWLCGAAATRAFAQAPDRAIEFGDLGFDRWLDASVRGAALSAFAATVADASALAYNPAGLARVKRFSAVATFGTAQSSFDGAYDGETRTTDLDESALQFVGAAFPLPVLRGSLVPAIGVHRIFTSSLDLSYQGFNAPDSRSDRFALQQGGGTYAVHIGGAIDLSAAFAAGVDLMLLDGNIDRVRQYDTQSLIVDPNVHTFVYEDIAADVGGYGARFGFEFYALEQLQLAVVLTTPMIVETDATIVTETTRQVDNDVGSFTRETSSQSTKYKTPYRVEGALSIPVSPALLLAAQVGYADWSQATIEDQRLITSDLESVMRSVLDVSAGIEWSFPRRPLRVRAGFAHARRSAGYLEADRIDNDRLERVGAESATTRYSLGAGYLLRGAIGIDAAFQYARGEQSSGTIADERSASSVYIGCGYWF